MKKEIRYLIYIMIGIISIVVYLSIIGVADNQKEYGINSTSSTTFEETTVDESTTRKPINESTTIKEVTTKETTTEIKEEQLNYANYDVPDNNTMKTYMDYRTITLKDSKQYKLQKFLAYTDADGIRMVNGRYCIAVGSYYTTTIGQYIDVELENGKVIKGILADCKADEHTDSTNRINPNGSVVEFVVDVDTLNGTAKKMGDISYINGWNSKVVNIIVYDEVEEF